MAGALSDTSWGTTMTTSRFLELPESVSCSAFNRDTFLTNWCTAWNNSIVIIIKRHHLFSHPTTVNQINTIVLPFVIRVYDSFCYNLYYVLNPALRTLMLWGHCSVVRSFCYLHLLGNITDCVSRSLIALFSYRFRVQVQDSRFLSFRIALPAMQDSSPGFLLTIVYFIFTCTTKQFIMIS